MEYHKPVLLDECIQGLNINPNGVYVDVTFGGGGHSKSIMSKLNNGKLYAFDQDENAQKNIINSENFKLIKANFRYIKNFLRLENIFKIDGLFADLGVSSHQFDVASRGFSTRLDAKLDMRMDINSDFSALQVVNEYSEEKLATVFYKYGDLRNSRKISKHIVVARKNKPIINTFELIDVIKVLCTSRQMNRFLARVFQAIRIEVNDEYESLKEMLLSTIDLLKPKGRLVVLSYHSLEDRLVKNFIRAGNFKGLVEKDFFGNQIKSFNEINKRVITAKSNEIENNSRARSAKLRIAEKKDEN